ncbi:hypothetical protein [Pseudaeromonas paramecii]|uniref:Uncharacterized protein n=1 Tax=Pseudaeromonas paramecii TaxID=2138166 RepID=A0ABP8PUZ0_9GAMM
MTRTAADQQVTDTSAYRGEVSLSASFQWGFVLYRDNEIYVSAGGFEDEVSAADACAEVIPELDFPIVMVAGPEPESVVFELVSPFEPSVSVPLEIYDEFLYMWTLYNVHGCAAGKFDTVQHLIQYVLRSVCYGSRRPGSWERGVLDAMGLVADCVDHQQYRAKYGFPAVHLGADDENAADQQPPYICQFCGAPSWLHPSEQSAPADYCSDSDHGSLEDYLGAEE